MKCIGLVLALFCVPAFALSYYGETADGGRPRCLVTGTGTNLFFTWKEAENVERKIWVARSRRGCAQWRKVGGLFTRWAVVPENVGSIDGMAVRADLKEALRQVRFGTRLIRAEATAEAWLDHNPIATYTVGINHWLSRVYGAGFSGEVYRAWVERQGGNGEFRAALLSAFHRRLRDGDGAAALKERTRGATILIAMGMGMDSSAIITSDTPALLRNAMTELPYLGPETKILRSRPLDNLWGNVVLLKEQIVYELDAGRDVVLVGLCKGVPELLAALKIAVGSTLDGQRRQSRRPPGRGKVLGFISLSGLHGGTFLADGLMKIPLHDYLGSVFTENFSSGDMNVLGHTLNQLLTLTVPEIQRFDRLWKNQLPTDMVYVSGIGVVSGKGFRETEPAFQLKIRSLSRKWHFTESANDAYIEYPKMELPAGMSDRQWSFVADGSHVLYDGYLDGVYMDTPAARRAFFQGLYETVWNRL